MSRSYLTGLVVCGLMLSAHLAAQTSQPPAKPSQPPANALTLLSGCLRQARADTTTANAKGVIYTLEAETQKLPTSPAPEGSGPIKMDGRYALSFDESVDLSKHVNHRVEVRGRLMPRAADKPAEAKPLPGAAQQMFHVTALKMLSPKCE